MSRLKDLEDINCHPYTFSRINGAWKAYDAAFMQRPLPTLRELISRRWDPARQEFILASPEERTADKLTVMEYICRLLPGYPIFGEEVLEQPEGREPLTFARLTEAVLARSHASYTGTRSWSLLECAGALAGEAGEFANLAKKLRRGDTVERERLMEELGGTQIYCVIAADNARFDLEQAVIYAFNEKSKEIGSDIFL